jgi:hypothetical protein
MRAGREASPTAVMLDSQCVNGAEKDGRRLIGPALMAARRSKGRKRHVLVDTHGVPMRAAAHAADLQGRDGRALLMATLFGLYPLLPKRRIARPTIAWFNRRRFCQHS